MSGGVDLGQHLQQVQQNELAELNLRLTALSASQGIFDALVAEYLEEIASGDAIDPGKIRTIASFAQRIGLYRCQAAGLLKIDEVKHWGQDGTLRP